MQRARSRRRPRGALCLALPLAAAPVLAQGGGNTDDVEIRYDPWAIAHVFGESDESALYGLGYHQMMEFPVGTLNLLWLSSGRMAEIAGPTYVDEDRLIRLWDVPAIAARHEAELAAKGLLPLLEAYVAGVEAGRAWWRENGDPATSSRLDALLGPQFQVRIDPPPDYLTRTFSPYGAATSPNVPVRARGALNNLFDPDMPVSVDHVLNLGIVINSFTLYRGNPFGATVLPPLPALPPPPAPPLTPEEEALRESLDAEPAVPESNGWMISRAASLVDRPIVLSDTHLNLNRIQIRPYLVQVEGPSYQATGLTIPGYPGPFLAFNDRLAWTVTAPTPTLSEGTWEVQLVDSPDAGYLAFDFVTDAGVERVELVEERDTHQYWDPASGAMVPYEDLRHYVPVTAAEGDLGFTRYPVIPQSSALPAPGSTIRFRQASFTVEASFWEWTLRMGMAADAEEVVDVVRDARGIFGDGNNLLVCDRDSNFLFNLMARVAIPGPEVVPGPVVPGQVLDGARLGQRWQGFHPFEDLPIIGPADVSDSPEAWLCNNTTPDNVELTRFNEADLASFPPYMVPQSTTTSWRQERAKELIRDPLVFPLLPLYSELVARDMTDAWAHEMWPLFQAAAALAPPTADGQLFLDWIEAYRHEDELGFQNPFYDFVAHRFSRVMPYVVLVRSFYLFVLGQLPTSPEQASLGLDAGHPVLDDPSLLTLASYGPNVQAMKIAIDGVAPLWRAGTGPNGLANVDVLEGLSPMIEGDPWGDSRFRTPIEPEWADVIDGDFVLRWGHVKSLAVTPHLLDLPKRQAIDALPLPLQFFQAYLFSALQPALLNTLPFGPLRTPYQTDHAAAVWPCGGTETSMLVTSHDQVLQTAPPIGYQESLYRWPTGQQVFYHPHTSGSQTLFSVQLTPKKSKQAAPWALFLQAIGGTEITVPDLLGDGTLAHQDRAANLQAFAIGLWRPLITKAAYLPDPTWELVHPGE